MGSVGLTNIIDEWVNRSNEYLSPQQSRRLSAYIERNAVPINADLYRTVSIKELGDFRTERQLQNNINDLVGKVITPGGFVATSKNESIGLGFSGVVVTVDPNGVKGVDISNISKRSQEQEVLFNKGTSYKVISARVIRDADGDPAGYDIKVKLISK